MTDLAGEVAVVTGSSRGTDRPVGGDGVHRAGAARRRRREVARPTGRRGRGDAVLLVAALSAAAVLTLFPTGTGWTWAPPVEELRWYVTGLDRPGTLVQLLGNLLLLVPAALAASRLRPGPAHVPALVASAAGVAVSVEVLQLVTAAGRVVSPVDALLNTAGAAVAVTAAAAVASVPRRRRAVDGRGGADQVGTRGSADVLHGPHEARPRG